MTSKATSRAFTLAELLTAIVVTSVLAGAVTTTLSNLARARGGVSTRLEALRRADEAADRIALDVMTVVRDHDLTHCRVRLIDQDSGAYPRDELLVLTRSHRRVRPLQDGPESAEQEAQYRVVQDADGPALWRRVDHAMDRAQDGGGVARPIVPGVIALSIQAFDGESWYDVWDSDYDGLPHALRISITAQSDVVDGKTPVSVHARRIVAIDRAPIPPETLDESDLSSPGDESDDAPGGADAGNGGDAGAGNGAGNGGGQAPGGGR